MKNPWSKNGIALYPPEYPLVGQNRIFNALHKFKQGFSSDDALCGFFVVIGDWGLGKTRIGLELITNTAGHMDEWLLGNEYILPNTNKRILEPQLKEGILPLFIDYKSTIDEDLGSDTWVAKVTCNALSLLWNRPKDLRVFSDLLDDLVKVLNAKGVDITELKKSVATAGDYSEKLEAAMQTLRVKGINTLWVVVDEVETPADLRQNPDYKPGTEIAEEDLVLIGQVIKEARYRDEHPYVNFLLLCSRGMSDAINIGPNRRRSDLINLEPNNISDVHILRKYLEDSGHPVDYPNGTLEGVFIATNRNFGWFNKVMSSIHTSWEGHKRTGGDLPPAWSLIKEYAQAEARANEVFDLSILKTLPQIAGDLQERLIYGQLPIQVIKDVDPTTTDKLLGAQVPGVGPAFARLRQIHIDEETLANQLVSPEFGFKKVDRPGDDYFNPYTELSVGGVLTALRAFSVSVEDGGDFVIYEDLDQFAEQLATLYPRERVDENKSIERSADYLHRIFMRTAVKDKAYLAVSFKLLKKINVKMTSESRSVAFFSDPILNEKIEQYSTEQSSSSKKRMNAICKGMAKVLDDSRMNLQPNGETDGVRYVSINSELKSPHFEGLSVTRDGRITVAYCNDVTQGTKELSEKLGRTGENAHPVLVLFGPDGDIDSYEKEAQRRPLLQRSIILRKLTTVEEEFLIKFSGRDEVFDSSATLSNNTHATLGGMRQDMGNRFQTWREAIDESGYLLRPLWFRQISGKEDFFRGYRYLIAKDDTVSGLDPAECKLQDWNDVSLSNFNNGAKKNTDPGKGFSSDCMSILSSDPFKPVIPPALVRILQEMDKPIGEDSLQKRFFFAARDSEVKGSQINQAIDLLTNLGVMTSPSTGQYKAINKNALDERRIVIATWLSTTAQELIEKIRNIFPDQAKALEKGFKAEANQELKKADEIAKAIDFSFINEEEPNIDAFVKMIKEVYKFDLTLQKIAPDDPTKPFDISDDRIKKYQEQYNTLSFWEKIHFLLWLQGTFTKKRDEIIMGIDEQIADASKDLSLVIGKPFPIAPVTQPLKSIKEELQAALSGRIGTMREYIGLPEYSLAISNYLIQGNFDYAWNRLKQLGELATKTNPDGYWSQFNNQYDSWKTVVESFSETEKAWNKLNVFLSNATGSLWVQKLAAIKKEYDALQGQVEGGLKQESDQLIGKVDNTQLLGKLEQEIDASKERPDELKNKIDKLYEESIEEVNAIINDINLQALNRLLRICEEDEWLPPSVAETYGDSKQMFESYNSLVSKKGRSLLEGKERQTNWELWVDIFGDLLDDDYQKKPEHEPCLQELEDLGLIVTKIVLV